MWDWRNDSEAPWWAKLRRARRHIDEVHERIAALRISGAYSIQREPSAQPNSWAYRFKMNQPVPADLCAAVGDAVANMRSSLDYIAYELALRHVGTLDEKQEMATMFPIFKNAVAFDEFFSAGRWGSVRAQLYGPAEREALKCVQPFAMADTARQLGVEWSIPPDEELRMDPAYVLNALWNIDKHRRLPVLAWALDGPGWWDGPGAMAVTGYTSLVAEHVPLEDSTVFVELRSDAGAGRPSVELHQDIDIITTDDPSPYPYPLASRLNTMHQGLTNWVVPRIFYVAEGAPPPMAMSFSPPG